MTALVRRDFDEGSAARAPVRGAGGVRRAGRGLHRDRAAGPAAPVLSPASPPDAAAERQALERAVQRAAAELERLRAASGGGGLGDHRVPDRVPAGPGPAGPGLSHRSTPASRRARPFRAALEPPDRRVPHVQRRVFRRPGQRSDRSARSGAGRAGARRDAVRAGPRRRTAASTSAEDLTPSRFLELDWSRWRGAALLGGSTASHVAILARSRGVPLLVGLQASLADAPDRRAGRPGRGERSSDREPLGPGQRAVPAAQTRRAPPRPKLEAGYRSAPAVSAAGRRITVQINVDERRGPRGSGRPIAATASG